jgi:SpoVK/Ycf46/Vps4 family AAA+-type ATPase
MKQEIVNYIRAGYPGIYLVSHEEIRAEAELKEAAKATKHGLYAWSATTGIMDTGTGRAMGGEDPMEAVTAITGLQDNSIVLLRDFHLFLQDSNPVLIRALKDALTHAKAKGKCLVVLGCRKTLPQELEREFVVVEMALPGKLELGRALDGICDSAKLKKPQEKEREEILDSASGLTTSEAENAFALSIVSSKAVKASDVSREKANAIKSNGLLEVVESKQGLEGIGGLATLKAWLLKRSSAFGQKAREYGLPVPKGMLIIGVPGTGKSLTAKATAAVFNRPLLKLDAGRLFGSLVGQSEGNLRSAIQTAEAIAPCVLWIDELEKAFAGSKSSGASDGGTGARVFGSFLSWMQEKTAPVFVIATANDVTQLPPELLRKGRWDELFFTDLPSIEEREQIWAIQISKARRNPKDFNLDGLSASSEGFTGAEIEQCVTDSLYRAFAEDREPKTADMATAEVETVPLSKLMGEQIEGLRKWARGRCRPAGVETADGEDGVKRRIAA